MSSENKTSNPPPFETVIAMAVIFLLSGSMLLWMSLRALPRKYELQSHGVPAEARITRCTSGRSSSSCEYSFLVNGDEVDGQDGATRYREGDSAQVLYLARDPSINEFTDNSSPNPAIGFGIFGGLMALVALGVIIQQLLHKRRTTLESTEEAGL